MAPYRSSAALAAFAASATTIASVATAFVPPRPAASVPASSSLPRFATVEEDDYEVDMSLYPGKGALSRRQLGEIAVGTAGLGLSFLSTRETKPTDYGLYGVLPVGPYKTKKTLETTVVPGEVWTYDQKFGILNVQVPVRSVVIKLRGGGLFVYNPVAATPEFVGMVKALEKEHGPVKHIVLGTVAIEHKVYAGVFAQKFGAAKVWLQPGQYSFPSNLPDAFLGFPAGRTYPMPRSAADAPEEWNDNFDFKTFGPLISRDGAFGETVFFHRDTKTLLVTDTVVEVTDEVPAIFDSDPNPLLYHARDTVTDVLEDTPEVRKRGWKRVVLFGLFFQPSAIQIKDVDTALKERRKDINPDFAGIYPWDWVGEDDASFKALTGGLLVAPILQKLILNRNPVEVLDFADAVSRWPIERIIPAHLKNDLKYTGRDYREAFGFLEQTGMKPGLPKPLEADLQTLTDANENLLEQGAIAKCPPLVGGKYTRAEIIAETAYNCRAGVCSPRSEP
uniref:DUF4336 domain-containing protein n=1 Tax=Trieres chinensis TaxID=1514140 RepID=A0A7S1ZID2_TRICV